MFKTTTSARTAGASCATNDLRVARSPPAASAASAEATWWSRPASVTCATSTAPFAAGGGGSEHGRLRGGSSSSSKPFGSASLSNMGAGFQRRRQPTTTSGACAPACAIPFRQRSLAFCRSLEASHRGFGGFLLPERRERSHYALLPNCIVLHITAQQLQERCFNGMHDACRCGTRHCCRSSCDRVQQRRQNVRHQVWPLARNAGQCTDVRHRNHTRHRPVNILSRQRRERTCNPTDDTSRDRAVSTRVCDAALLAGAPSEALRHSSSSALTTAAVGTAELAASAPASAIFIACTLAPVLVPLRAMSQASNSKVRAACQADDAYDGCTAPAPCTPQSALSAHPP